MKFACVFSVSGERKVLGAVEAADLPAAIQAAKRYAIEEERENAEMSVFASSVGVLAWPGVEGCQVLVLAPSDVSHLAAGCCYSEGYKAEMVAHAAALVS